MGGEGSRLVNGRMGEMVGWGKGRPVGRSVVGGERAWNWLGIGIGGLGVGKRAGEQGQGGMWCERTREHTCEEGT